MRKTDLVSAVAKQAGISNSSAKQAVDAVIETIGDALKKGDSVQLIGFGTFDVQKRAARKGRNPLTGEEIKIKASKSPRFKAGKALKDKVNGK